MPRARLAVTLAGLPLVWVTAGGACGPSYQTIHEGGVRFEHCYRLDLDPRVGATHRQRCWGEWVERYTYGQTSDRIDYARRRAREIAAGDLNRPQLEIREDPDAAISYTDPQPTSVHAPPPSTALPPPASDAAPPGAECATSCRATWTACAKGDAARQADAGSCDADYAACMRRCFGERPPE